MAQSNLFTLFSTDLPPELKQNIIKAHKAKISDKAISRFLKIPLAEVKKVIAQAEQQRLERVELQRWAALIG